mmetsp:Transcript_29602/g.45807  ORF Transcript_29602/g.45807 Transcript_29602/m.45807 type:complete len:248 (+) Transcript_29602:39-782(+)
MFATKKKSKKKEQESSGRNAALDFLVKKEGGADGRKTLNKLIDSHQLVIGAYPDFMVDPNKIHKELTDLIDNEGVCNFANNQSIYAQRSAVAFGPPSYFYKYNKNMLADHAPTLNQFVTFIEEAYEKTGKVLTGLWWTFYRSETEPGELVVVDLGVMKPHRDKLPGAITDRFIATLGCNTNGKQKRMSFGYQKKPKSKVWIDIHHGMYICLSKESSGHDKFNGKYVQHGVEGAEGTWTITMEFSLKK